MPFEPQPSSNRPVVGEPYVCGEQTIVPSYVRESEKPGPDGGCVTEDLSVTGPFVPAGWYVEYRYEAGGEQHRNFIPWLDEVKLVEGDVVVTPAGWSGKVISVDHRAGLVWVLDAPTVGSVGHQGWVRTSGCRLVPEYIEGYEGVTAQAIVDAICSGAESPEAVAQLILGLFVEAGR